MLKTRDNNYSSPLIFSDDQEEDLKNLSILSDVEISEVAKDNPDLLIFPQCLDYTSDDIEKNCIFSISNRKLTTTNIVGFIGVKGESKETELSIHSRFTDNEQDYFLHYMLQLVMSINIFDLEHSFTSDDPVFDLLKFLFPKFLNDALTQGLYKEYVTNSYNDSYVHGTVDVTSFIRLDVPFQGKIASKAREHSYDNSMTELIRHTIELLKTDAIGSAILSNNKETIDSVSIIERATPGYQKNNRMKVIDQNLKPKNHPYFTKYRVLQRICLQILRHDGIKYTASESKSKIYGVLFDVAWLWEEYINVIFREHKCNVIHPENKTGKKGLPLFVDNGHYVRYPDFYTKNRQFVMDAKYKRLKVENYGSASNSIDRDDMHQLITYMYMLKAETGIFLFPNETETSDNKVGVLSGYSGQIKTCSLCIPHDSKSYKDFTTSIRTHEKSFLSNVLNEISK